MALNFPDNPVLDEQFAPVDLEKVFTWNGVRWVTGGSGGSSGPTPPADYLPLAGGTLSGALLLPTPPPTVPEEATHKQYVDESIAAQSLYQGVWQPAANIPDLTPAVTNPLHSYSWIAQTVDPLVPETPPAGIPGLTGVINSADTVIWNDNLTAYEIVRSPAAASGFLPLTGGTLTGDLRISKPAAMMNMYGATSGVLSYYQDASTARWALNMSPSTFGLHASGAGDVFTVDRASRVATWTGAITAGTVTINDTLALSSATLTCPEGSKLQFHSTAMFISSTANTNIRYDVAAGAEHSFWTGSTKRFSVTDSGGALLGADAESLSDGLSIAKGTEGDVSIGKAMVAMLAKIKQLEAELTVLKMRT